MYSKLKIRVKDFSDLIWMFLMLILNAFLWLMWTVGAQVFVGSSNNLSLAC